MKHYFKIGDEVYIPYFDKRDGSGPHKPERPLVIIEHITENVLGVESYRKAKRFVRADGVRLWSDPA